MKNRQLQHLGFSMIVYLACHSIFAQEKKDIYSSSVWLKGKNPTVSVGNKEENKENDLTKYFNFNPAIDFSKEKIQKKLKGIIEKKSSLFVVFKSDSKDPVDLFTLKNGSSITTLSTQKVFDENDISYHKGRPEKGIIVSYLYNKNSTIGKKRGALTFSETLFNSTGKDNILELIYIPRMLTVKEQNTIESYLSLKYGISLIGDKDYYNSQYEKIWDFKSNADYAKRITGIGRDDDYNLYQKQSGNYEKDGIYLGLTKIAATNALNQSVTKTGSFWIWGDNDKGTMIKKDEKDLKGIKKMERVWKIQTTHPDLSKNASLQLLLNKKELLKGLEPESDEMIWLAIDTTGNGTFDFKKAVYIPSINLTNGNLVFDNLRFKSNSTSLFTFTQAPDLIVVTDYASPDCNSSQNGALKINLYGGKAPYRIKLQSDNYFKNYDVTGFDLTIPNLLSGTYKVEVSDSARHIYSTEITVNTFEKTPVSLKEEWLIDSSKEVLVTALVLNEQDIVSYQWYKGETMISQSKQFLCKEIGDYKLLVTNNKGCDQVLYFKVLDKNLYDQNQWLVFPNPVASGDPFSVSFNFQTPTKTTVSIYDLGGKLIQFKDLGTITSMQYKYSLTVAGTYMITCSINGTLQSSKLIVK